MATDWLPRFADIKSIEELSGLLAYPMLIAAFILQNGLSIHVGDIDIHAPVSADSFASILWMCGLFVVKAAWICLWALAAIFLLSVGQLKLHFPFLLFAGGLLMAFALVGVFGREYPFVTQLGLIRVWYYAIFVFGVYLIIWDKKNNSDVAA